MTVRHGFDEPRADFVALADAIAAREATDRDAEQQRQQGRRDIEAALLLAEAARGRPGAAAGRSRGGPSRRRRAV